MLKNLLKIYSDTTSADLERAASLFHFSLFSESARFLFTLSCWFTYSVQFYSLFIPEDEVKYQAYYCKDNACSSQDGEDDSEGKIY